MNKKNIRADFPFFMQEKSRQVVTRDIAQNTVQNMVYVDNASTTQKPQAVIDAIADFYAYHNANIGRGIYPLAEEATQLYENTREKVQKFIGARYACEIVFTKGATEGINLVAQAWALKNIEHGQEIVLSEFEHHANLLPWQEVAWVTGASLKFIPILKNGDLNYSTLNTLITHKTKLIAVTHVSHALGTHVDIARIAAHARRVGARLLIDAAQSAGHQQINVQELGCDFLAFSGHKMLGPTGVGVLYIKKEMHDQIQPYQRGGGMVFAADWREASWAKMPHMLEAGTPPIAQVIGLGAAIDYLQQTDNLPEGLPDSMLRSSSSSRQEGDARPWRVKHEAALCAQLIDGLNAIPGIRILGPIAHLREQGHLVSFVVEDMHAHDVAAYLGARGICVRAGHHCAQPLATALSYVASVRVSFYLYNTEQEVDYILQVLQELVTKRDLQ